MDCMAQLFKEGMYVQTDKKLGYPSLVCVFKKDFIYLLMRDRDIGRGRSRLPVGSLMRDLIPGPRVHDLSGRQDTQLLSDPGAPPTPFSNKNNDSHLTEWL